MEVMYMLKICKKINSEEQKERLCEALISLQSMLTVHVLPTSIPEQFESEL